jgi:argininosuccinate lyase
MPFREAHELVGKMVLHCTKTRQRFSDLELSEFQKFSNLFQEGIHDLLAPESIVNRRDTLGGTAPRRVRAALKKARKRLS